MLVKLMEEIKKGGTLEVNRLAQQLDTTPQMVSLMMEHLQKSGFIKQYETCMDACGDCQMATACGHKKGNGVTQIWSFEEKKRQVNR
jgi:hypothetical protein